MLPAEAEMAFRDILQAACRAAGGGWQVEAAAGDGAFWLRAAHRDAARPEQGWKLHLSATVLSAGDVLRDALPILLAAPLRFKIAASESVLAALNAGEGGLSQAGKFLTVYPADDAQAVRLAGALDRATRGRRGPAILSDRPLAPGSLVHYRYGSFGERFIQIPSGAWENAIQAPDGRLVPDRRSPAYCPPEWAADPFVAAGLAAALPDESRLIAGRYLVGATLHQSARGDVRMTLDVETGERRTLKRARRDAAVDRDGQDAQDRLRHEADVLARLAPDPRFPQTYGLLEHAGDLFLVMEDMEGRTLDAHLDARLRAGRLPSGVQVAAWGREMAAMLRAIHAGGFVYGDLKSSNVLVAPDGRLRLLDFEYACRLWEPPSRTRGTRGYLAPSLAAGAPPAFADDAYALGALLFFAATGAQPSQAPCPFALCDRPPIRLNPSLPPQLARVISDCLSQGGTMSLSSLDTALAGCAEEADIPPPPFGTMPAETPETEARQASLEAARGFGDVLCRAACPAPDGIGLTWPMASRPLSRDLHDGDSGVALALAALVKALGVPAHAEALAGGACRLAAAPLSDPRCTAGLYAGEAGVGLALLRAGQALGEERWVAAALARGRWVAAQPLTTPDLFGGAAGRVRFHLRLWQATGEAGALTDAVAAGNWLLCAGEAMGEGRCWRIGGAALPGYAHGAAGIGDVLLDLFTATGEARFRSAAQDAARWLVKLAVLTEDGGAAWPMVAGGDAAFPFWRHGAAGICPFLARAAKEELLPDMGLVRRAAWSTARGARWAGPALANGLAGNIGALLDSFEVTGNPAFLAEVHSLADLLRVWTAAAESLPPGYLTGAAGIALCWLRLGAVDSSTEGTETRHL